jgi:hypothetical protein
MFNFDRFLRLAGAHWAEQKRNYLWFLAMGMMLHIVLLIIIFAVEDGYRTMTSDGQGVIYFAGLFLLVPIFAGRYFQQMSRRQAGLLVLMRPASVFEKWLLAVVCIVVAYPLAYTLAFYLCDIPAWLIAHASVARDLASNPAPDPNSPLRDLKIEHYRLFHPLIDEMTWKDLLQIVVILSVFQGFAVFGSLYFRTIPFIKTLFTAFLLMLIMILLSAVFEANTDMLFGFWDSQRPMSPLQKIVFPTLWVVVPLLLWLSTFLVLKEREIAP